MKETKKHAVLYALERAIVLQVNNLTDVKIDYDSDGTDMCIRLQNSWESVMRVNLRGGKGDEEPSKVEVGIPGYVARDISITDLKPLALATAIAAFIDAYVICARKLESELHRNSYLEDDTPRRK